MSVRGALQDNEEAAPVTSHTLFWWRQRKKEMCIFFCFFLVFLPQIEGLSETTQFVSSQVAQLLPVCDCLP